MSLPQPPRTLTLARVQAVEIAVHWRWAGVLLCCMWLLAQNVLPARFPLWEQGTAWLTSVAVILGGEMALLLHEVSHALVARRRGQRVTRIVFHGFQAETVVSHETETPGHDALIALVGPGVNLLLAAAVAGLRFGLAADGGPLDLVLVILLLSNVAMAAMSLVPIGGSDGARALSALRAQRYKPRFPVSAMINTIKISKPSGDQP